MADEKGLYPVAPAGAYPRSDQFESAMAQPDDELRRKKRLRLYTYIAVFAIFQIIVILVFALVVMRVRSPNVEIRSVVVEGLNVGTSSYNMTLIAEVRIKNKNFGDYKYDTTNMTISHGGVAVGNGIIWKGKAEAKDTETMIVTVTVSSNALASGDINSGTVILNSHAALRGKVHLIKMWGIEMQFTKKRKGANMDCTMELNLMSGLIQNMDCDD